MSLLLILKNHRLISLFFKSGSAFLRELAVMKAIPKCESRHFFLGTLEDLLRHRVIDLDGDREIVVANFIRDLRGAESCKK